MNLIQRFADLKDKVSRLQRESDQASGALDECLRRLSEEFDCDSIDQAKKLLVKIKAEEKEAEETFTAALEEFEEEWSDFLSV